MSGHVIVICNWVSFKYITVNAGFAPQLNKTYLSYKKAARGSLFQVQNGQEKLIAYNSNSLPPSAERWSISDIQ
jgi:hypothetical protein